MEIHQSSNKLWTDKAIFNQQEAAKRALAYG